ncbi:MAG: phosphodiester glycosidase family protein [Miltoncostaeaceae bacterium]
MRRDAPGQVLPNVPFTGTVVGRRGEGGSTIGANHVVLTGSGSQGARLSSELPLGSKISIAPAIEGLPEDAVAALGGGPVLVRDGEAIASAGEGFSTSQLGSRTSRTAIGQRANGAIILVLAEGPSQGSRGVTAGEQAALLKELGARTAIAMDAGGSAQLAVFNRLLPSTATRSVTDAFAVSYRGVQLPPLPKRISPNGDGVDDTATTPARAPVAGRLRLTVAKRNGSSRRQLRNRPLGPGALETTLNPRSLRLQDGIYVVTAVFVPFDGSPASRQTRRVIVDRTLSHLSTRPFTRRKRPQLDTRFRLTRPARVTVRVLDAAGNPLKVLVSGKVLRAGRHRVNWNRRARGITISGTVTLQVEARNRLGRSGLQDTLTLKKPPSPLTLELRRRFGSSR